MPKPPSPWFRLGRGWYVTLDGTQHPLGVRDPDAHADAVNALRRLLETLADKPRRGTVGDAVTRFIAHQEGRGLSPGTLTWYRFYLARLAEKFGAVEVGRLDPARVQADCGRVDTWGGDTRRNYLSAVEAVLKFAGRAVKFDKPPRGSAGERAVIPEAVYALALEAATGDLRPMLVVLWNTGARPGEIRLLTCDQVDWSAGVATLTQHKTARKTGRKRLIVFPPAALTELERQREKYHRRGLLFRTRNNTPFGRSDLTKRMWVLSARIGHTAFLYGFRHSYVTEALARGVPDATVAALVGHADTSMIHRFYSHLSSRTQVLKDAAARVRPAG